MRVIFYALLLANLLYLGWTEWIDVPPPPPPNPIAALPRLTLVSDLPPAKRAALASKMSPQTPPSQCISVGPFKDPVIAAKAAEVLKAKSLAPQQRAAESPAVRRFWVYLEGFKTDAAEMRVLHRLERAGIDDAEAMPAAAGGRRVSLGLFLDRDRAELRANAARAMGLTPAIMERMLPGTVYWLDLTLPGGATAVPLKDVTDLEPGGGSPISVQPCASPPSPTQPGSPSPAPAQTGSPTSTPAAKPAPQTSSAAPTPVSAETLPRCKPDGSGPVPCVTSDPKAATRPSVL